MSVYDVLAERGFLKQVSHEEEIRELLEKEKITFYIGFDPTADSLHVGHFIALMAMSHMQKAGHRPIVLLGGGTGMVGDPSGKDEMRKMLTPEFIAHNIACFKKQMSRFIDFSDDKAIMVNNADWLLDLNYIKLLREVGVHFSVNRMLTAECFKKRLERGLSFFEFNYMIMQAYDFWTLNKKYGCIMEMGGDDQWLLDDNQNKIPVVQHAGRCGTYPPQRTETCFLHDLQAFNYKRRQKNGQNGKRRFMARPGKNISV